MTKAGWQYLWVQYQETHDTTAKNFARRPVGVYVEKVYWPANFGLLGIGS